MYNYKTYLLVLFGSLAISIALQSILPFPYGLAVSLAIFVMFPLIIRRQMSNKDGTSSFYGLGSGKVKYICLVCNARFKGAQCSRCGSKSKKADF